MTRTIIARAQIYIGSRKLGMPLLLHSRGPGSPWLSQGTWHSLFSNTARVNAPGWVYFRVQREILSRQFDVATHVRVRYYRLTCFSSPNTKDVSWSRQFADFPTVHVSQESPLVPKGGYLLTI